ncbi:transposase [bacterium]|nr:MAG: transposase [bacterium]
MKYNPLVHHRRSIRLRGYDYAQPGEYFITSCTSGREHLFGEIENGIMKLSELGRIVTEEWLRTPTIRSNVELDEFIVMPDHFHGIIDLHAERNGEHEQDSSCGGELQFAPTVTPFRSPSKTIGAIIRGFKAAATKRANELRKTPGLPLWQRNYYEHIIRDQMELDRIREYILLNPAKWMDEEEIKVVEGKT